MITGFDIETPDAEPMFNGGYQGPFVRPCGWIADDGEPQISTDPNELLDVLAKSKMIYGHGILGYDLVALAAHCGIDTLVGAPMVFRPHPSHGSDAMRKLHRGMKT